MERIMHTRKKSMKNLLTNCFNISDLKSKTKMNVNRTQKHRLFYFFIFALWFVTVWMRSVASFIALKYVPMLNTNSTQFDWKCSDGTFHRMECAQLLSEASSSSLSNRQTSHSNKPIFSQSIDWLVSLCVTFISIEHHLNNGIYYARTTSM